MKNVEKLSPFGRRLLEAFENAPKIFIAKRIGVEPSALTNYLQSRIPDAEKLQIISNFTNCSIHWLITGEGKKYISDDFGEEPKDILLGVLDERIRTIVQQELDKREQKEETNIPVFFNGESINVDDVLRHLRDNKNLSEDTSKALAELFLTAYSMHQKEETKSPAKVQQIKADTKRLSLNFDNQKIESGVSNESLKRDYENLKRDRELDAKTK